MTIAGAIVWHTDEAPFGKLLIDFGTISLCMTLLVSHSKLKEFFPSAWITLDDYASALLLGAAISAMLMGHSYLIAPAMSLSPLNRLLGLLAVWDTTEG